MASRMSMKKKICLLGDSAVGKTSLIRRFVYDRFDDKHIATIGTKITKKDITVRHPTQALDVSLTIMIWDIIGQIGFRKLLHDAHFSGATGALVVCDITRKSTLDNLDEWLSSLFEIAGEVPIIFLANKNDLDYMAEFGEDELKAVASKYKSPHYFTSAKTGDKVEEAFYEIGQRII